ncbi:Dps family protein [Gorillibacterium massiliense]|uniref:Dps family protein n=1 Tax=Gorillibacterium massiliense TaxID=1280390 RepID=UPI0004AE0C8B|nr:Dps family protein [Gorillibacterium massiliense]
MAEKNEKVIAVLNQQVATWTVLYTKLHNYHWFVKGELFFVLHPKFEELYDEATENMDATAERVLTLGGEPVAKLTEALKLSVVEEAAGGETPREMVATLLADYEKMTKGLHEGIEIAEEAGDAVTADFFTQTAAVLEKHCWMLRAHLA